MSDQLDRVLARVVHIDPECVEVVIPGWDTQEKIQLRRTQIPFPLLTELRPKSRFFCHMNLSADSVEQVELDFKLWQMAPEPNPDDGLAPE